MTYEMSDRRFWDQRAATITADVAAEAAHATTPEGRIERLRSERAGLRLLVVENGQDHTARIAQIDAEIAALTPAPKADAWTKDETIARRAAWNTKIASGDLNHARGMVDPAKVNKYEREIGWHMSDLKTAIKRHGL